MVKKRRPKKTKGPTPTENKFIVEYMACGYNGKAAYLNLYPDSDPAKASGKARGILNRKAVKAALARVGSTSLEHAQIDADKLIAEMTRLAFFDPIEAFDENGKMKPWKDIPADLRRAISYVQQTEKNINIKMVDKTKMMELLGKTFAMFTDKHRITDDSDMADKILAGRNRMSSLMGSNEN